MLLYDGLHVDQYVYVVDILLEEFSRHSDLRAVLWHTWSHSKLVFYDPTGWIFVQIPRFSFSGGALSRFK